MIAFGAAIDYLSALGMERVREHERELVAYAIEAIGGVPDIKILGPRDSVRRGGVVAFNLAISTRMTSGRSWTTRALPSRRPSLLPAAHEGARTFRERPGRASMCTTTCRRSGRSGDRTIKSEGDVPSWRLTIYIARLFWTTIRVRAAEARWLEHPYASMVTIRYVVMKWTYAKNGWGKVVDVMFNGRGCSISQASASMMTEGVKGLADEDADELVGGFREMMVGSGSLDGLDGNEGSKPFKA